MTRIRAGSTTPTLSRQHPAMILQVVGWMGRGCDALKLGAYLRDLACSVHALHHSVHDEEHRQGHESHHGKLFRRHAFGAMPREILSGICNTPEGSTRRTTGKMAPSFRALPKCKNSVS